MRASQDSLSGLKNRRRFEEDLRAERDIPPITTSIGIAPFGAGQRLSCETVLGRADAAIYEAKDAGRDSVRIFGGSKDGVVVEARSSAGQPS